MAGKFSGFFIIFITGGQLCGFYTGTSAALDRYAQPKMDGFLELNRHKLRFAFTVTSIIFLTIVSILLAIGYFKGQFPDIVLSTTVLLTAGIGFPTFIIAVAYLEWLSKRRVRKKAFSKPPFNELDKIGFSKSFINDKTKWFFTEEIKEGIVNDFKIKCDVTRENSKIVQFKALTKSRQIDKNEAKTLRDRFKRNNIEFDWGGFVKIYNIRQPAVLTTQQLKSDLELFTTTLKQENFEPEK